MLDINLIRTDSKGIAAALAKRGVKVDFEPILKLDEHKREEQTKLENLRAERNRASDEIGKTPDKAERAKKIAATKELGEKIGHLETKVRELDAKLFELLAGIPNTPLPEVQAGDKEQNKVVKTFGKQPKFAFKPLDHVELCTRLGLIDYERGAKMSGARSWVYTGMGARLEWALLNYMIDFHMANGFTLIMPPHILNYESGYSAGQFPKFIDDVFVTTTGDGVPADNGGHSPATDPKFRFLLPTSETALINMHRGEIIPVEKLPIKYAGFSPCYRKEAGGYRTSERGMIRGHQFHKVEMFAFAKPEQSMGIFKEFVRNAEKLVEGLGLHYQTMALAAGDVSASMAITYDIEVFIPSMAGENGGYKEVSSCSNAMDYQARRASIRTKIDGVNAFVHTLNASGLATSRILPAIVEQFQTKDGHVRVPEVLRKYLGGIEEI